MIDNITKKQNKQTKATEFPHVLDRMQSQDADFEVVISNSIQRLRLFHKLSRHRPFYSTEATKSVGVIFINTKYAKEELEGSLDSTKEFFNSLGINDLRVFEDETSLIVGKVFEGLNQEAIEFSQSNEGKENFAVFVRWIGIGV